jgi:opacity protein-like surface antigen
LQGRGFCGVPGCTAGQGIPGLSTLAPGSFPAFFPIIAGRAESFQSVGRGALRMRRFGLESARPLSIKGGEMSKKLLAIALGTAATIGVVHAAPPAFYIGGDVVGLTTKIDDKTGANTSGSAKATALRLRGGAHILDWLDAELHFVLSPQDKSYSTTGTSSNKSRTTVAAAFAKPNINVGPVNLYGLIGFASTKVDLSGSLMSGTRSEAGVAYGVGVQYPFTGNLSGSIDYVQYLKKKNYPTSAAGGLDIDVKAIGVGVNYTFR